MERHDFRTKRSEDPVSLANGSDRNFSFGHVEVCSKKLSSSLRPISSLWWEEDESGRDRAGTVE